MDVLIEEAFVEDAEAILTLQKLAYQSEAELYEDFALPPLAESLEQVRARFRDYLILKATLRERLAGAAQGRLLDGVCYIARVVVHPDFQNRGIGTQLMVTLESRFSHAGRFELHTGHRSEKNIHLYEKLGYRIFKTVPEHERLSLVYMEKLSAGSPGQ